MLAYFTQGFKVILWKRFKMFPQIFSSLCSALDIFLYFSSLRINDRLLLCYFSRSPLNTRQLPLKLDDPDVVLTLEVTRHAGRTLVDVVHTFVADNTYALIGIVRVHTEVFPHPTSLLPCSIDAGFVKIWILPL